MHDTAYKLGKLFLDLYWKTSFKKILDYGSLDVNGSFRDFCPEGAEYIGVDMVSGSGVDIVLHDPCKVPLPDESIDVILSSSAFEHDPMFWQTFLEMLRLLKPGGVIYVNAPSNGAVHRYSQDSWRFYPDSGQALEKWGKHNGHSIHLIESFWANRIGDSWNDCVMIFRKGNLESPEMSLSSSYGTVSNVYDRQSKDLLYFSEKTEDMQIIENLKLRVAHLDDEIKAIKSSRGWKYLEQLRKIKRRIYHND